MPEALARAGIEREQAVGEEIVAKSVRAIKIKGGGSSGNVDDAANRIEGHSGPVIGGAAGFPCVARPGVVTEFAGNRNSVKRPAKFAGADIEGTNVAGRSRKGFWIAAADNNQVFENEAGTGENNGVGAGRFAAKIFAKIDTAVIAKLRNGFAGGGIESVEKVHYADEDASGGSGTPIGEAAIGLRAFYARIEFPKEFAVGGVERKNFLCGCDAEKNSVYDQRIGLEAAFFSGVEGPGDLEFRYIAAIDLCEGREMIALRGSTVAWPVLPRWWGGGC